MRAMRTFWTRVALGVAVACGATFAAPREARACGACFAPPTDTATCANAPAIAAIEIGLKRRFLRST